MSYRETGAVISEAIVVYSHTLFKLRFRKKNLVNILISVCQHQDISSSSSDTSNLEPSEVSDYELEIEEFETQSEESQSDTLAVSTTTTARSVLLPTPYEDEPIADEKWTSEYNERREQENMRVQELQDRLDSQIPIDDW